MKILREIHFKTKGVKKTLCLGMPNTDLELKEMFKLRYKIYLKLGYISKGAFPKKIEQDDYDKGKKCDYFLAKVDDQIVGSARLIQNYYLPTEKECFTFEEPSEIRNVPRGKRGEIGRLIISKKDNNFLPPHLVLLGILDSIMRLSFQKDLRVGYSFIKKSLMEKLKKLRVPFHIIESYTQIYSKKHLWGYFHNTKDPVLPVYYFRDEAKKYLNKIFNNKKIFKKISKREYLYLPNNSWKFLFYIGLSSLFH